MKQLFVLVLLSAALGAFSQDWPVKKMVTAKKESGVAFAVLPVFSFVASKTLANRGIYQELKLDAAFLGSIMEQRPPALQLSIPLGNGKSINCELVQFSLGNIKITENNSTVLEHMKIPVTYRGVISDEQNKNTVILTVNDDYLSLVATTMDGAIQITKADETNRATYRLYNSANIQFPVVAPFDCGTKNNQASRTANGIDLTGVQVNPLAVQDKCVNVFVDCMDSLYQWQKSNTQQTVYYVYELFNIVAGGYLNEQINIQITTINVWTTTSPYRRDVRNNALYDLAAKWQDNFWGNICVGLDYSLFGKGRAGIAGGTGRVKGTTANTCPVYNAKDSASACCYNDLNYNVTVKNFPTGPNTTQPQVYEVMHEIGHLLGAHHTKWCGWKLTSNPDTYGTLDSCGVIEPIGTEPPCAQGPPPPANGATIMSYCVSNNSVNDFVSYTNGFGTLPGNAIRNFVDQSACILTCVECFGVNNKPYNSIDAFQNNTAAIKKESGPGGGNPNEPAKQQPAAQLINIQKIKQ